MKALKKKSQSSPGKKPKRKKNRFHQEYSLADKPAKKQFVYLKVTETAKDIDKHLGNINKQIDEITDFILK